MQPRFGSFLTHFQKWCHGVDKFTRHAFPFSSHLQSKYKMMAVIPISLFLYCSKFSLLALKSWKFHSFIHICLQAIFNLMKSVEEVNNDASEKWFANSTDIEELALFILFPEFVKPWGFHVYDISVDINKREEERLHRADGWENEHLAFENILTAKQPNK